MTYTNSVKGLPLRPDVFFFSFLPRAKTENLEEEEATEANYRKQGAHGIFFFFLNVLAVFAGGRRRRGRRSLCLLFFIEDKHSC